MEKSKNIHIYAGLGTLVLVLGTAFLIDKLLSKNKNKINVKEVDNIDYSVFDSPDAPGSGKCIDRGLVAMLLQLEQKTGYPIFEWINSGVRTPFWNSKVGGVANSSHLIPTCKAVDLKAANTTIRNNLVMAAYQVGFKRIGVANTFVHLDVDTNKTQYVAWGYPAGTKPPINPFE